MCKGPRRPRCDTCIVHSDGVKAEFDVGEIHFSELAGSAREQILYRKKRPDQQWLLIYLIFICFGQRIMFTVTLKSVRKKIIILSTTSDDTIACDSLAVEKSARK